MSRLSIQQTAQYAINAGFTGSSLATMVAIAMCESGLDPMSDNPTTSGLGTDQGLVKINTYFHPEVSTACAHDPQCAMQQAWRISKNGQDFHEWVTYTNGCYRGNVSQVVSSLQGTTQLKSLPGGCPWYCNIATGIGGITVSVPGADCSGCDKNKQINAAAIAAQATQGVVTSVTQGIVGNTFGPLLDAAKSWGLHIGLFMLGLLLVVVGFWILAGPPPTGAIQGVLKGGAS